MVNNFLVLRTNQIIRNKIIQPVLLFHQTLMFLYFFNFLHRNATLLQYQAGKLSIEIESICNMIPADCRIKISTQQKETLFRIAGSKFQLSRKKHYLGMQDQNFNSAERNTIQDCRIKISTQQKGTVFRIAGSKFQLSRKEHYLGLTHGESFFFIPTAGG